ncbi:hypothetical protein [Paenibacillus faecis]|uniref:hypothetical protein n=1 Tax=Paenibacillus faecis TaxID=862114 RepID=UPI001BD04301|nr:hypothetical protein [Paenibacillus faecis]
MFIVKNHLTGSVIIIEVICHIQRGACVLPGFQLQKDANLQVFKPDSRGNAKKDANLQAFPAILEKRAGFVENSCRFAGI